MKLAAAVIVVGVLASGCGGGSSSAQSGGTGGATSDRGSSFTSVAALASALGCSASFEQDAPADKTLFTSESGACDLSADSHAYLSTFTAAAPRDNFLEAAKQNGGRYVVGDRWVVYSDDDSAAEEIQSKLGGDIRG